MAAARVCRRHFSIAGDAASSISSRSSACLKSHQSSPPPPLHGSSIANLGNATLPSPLLRRMLLFSDADFNFSTQFWPLLKKVVQVGHSSRHATARSDALEQIFVSDSFQPQRPTRAHFFSTAAPDAGLKMFCA
jgi:hypothetical protein